MTGATYCSVYGCGNNSKKMPHLSFFGTPKDRDRIKVWATRMGRPDILEKEAHKKFYVCSIHFVSDMFKNKRLKAGAVPALHLPAAVSSLQHLDELKLHIPIQQISDGGHGADDDNTVTELIYSEEHNDYIERSVKVNNTKKRTQTDKGKEDTKKAKQGNGSSDEPKISNDEIDKFGKYIASLLKRMPRQLSRKLQYKIVNLIKDAKLEYGINEDCSNFEAMASTSSFSNILLNQNNETYSQIKDNNMNFDEDEIKPEPSYSEVTEENADDDPLPPMQYVETCLGTSQEQSQQRVLPFYKPTTTAKSTKSRKHANEIKDAVKIDREVKHEIYAINETQNNIVETIPIFDNLPSIVQVKIEEYDPIDNNGMKNELAND